jgi:hypothetical protein
MGGYQFVQNPIKFWEKPQSLGLWFALQLVFVDLFKLEF